MKCEMKTGVATISIQTTRGYLNGNGCYPSCFLVVQCWFCFDYLNSLAQTQRFDITEGCHRGIQDFFGSKKYQIQTVALYLPVAVGG